MPGKPWETRLSLSGLFRFACPPQGGKKEPDMAIVPVIECLEFQTQSNGRKQGKQEKEQVPILATLCWMDYQLCIVCTTDTESGPPSLPFFQ